MMKKYRSLLLLVLYIVLPNLYFSQKSDKIWIDGLGRSFFSSDAQINEEDTISASNISSGYNLIDLNTHINPFETIEIFGQVRIKNEFGSFFGSGTQKQWFSCRFLWFLKSWNSKSLVFLPFSLVLELL